MAFWYTAPVHDSTQEDPERGTVHPCRSTGGCGRPAGIYRVHCYDPPEAPTTCLVGMHKEVSLPGWSALTLQEAKDHFEAFYGRQPSEREVG